MFRRSVTGASRHWAGTCRLLNWTVVCGIWCCAASVVGAGLPAADVPPLSGLVLWLDASDLAGDGSQEPGEGTTVAVWKDRSEQGNHVSQSAAAHQPTLHALGIAGRPVVRFDGNDVLDRPLLQGFAAGDQPFHVVVVMQAAAHGAHPHQRLIDFPAADGQYQDTDTVRRNGFWIGYQGNGKNRVGVYYGNEGEALSTAWDNRPHLVEAAYAGSQRWAHFLDGRDDGDGTFSDGTFTGFAGGAKLALGQHHGHLAESCFFRGDVAAVLVYQRVLTAKERYDLGHYLETRYDLPTSFAPPPEFEQDVLPLLAQKCHDCHGEETQEAELDLSSLAGVFQGGVSGPAIVRGHPEQSKLFFLVRSGKMPPDQDGGLSPGQVNLLRRWIAEGAPSRELVDTAPREMVSAEQREFWAFRKIAAITPPAVQHEQRVRTPVDRFVLSRLEAAGLTWSPDAARHSLVRRAYFDLIGLPPTPQQVAEFLADDSPHAYEQLIDRLLDSPHFGERWGRHWLDEAGFADTFGADIDAPALFLGNGGKWKYRDYVVRSFNQDKTFDRFLTEQLAGDELVDWRNAPEFTAEIRENLIATGFLRCSADDTDQDVLNTPDLQFDVLHRTGEMLATNLLGLTVNCAKCHNHKYEPIPQRDYYRLMSFFQPAYNPESWLQPEKRALTGLSAAERTEIERETKELEQRLESLRNPQREQLVDAKFAELPPSIRADTKTAIGTPEEKRNEVQKYLAAKLEARLQPTEEEFRAAMQEGDRELDIRSSARLAELITRQQAAGFIQAIYEVGSVPQTRMHYRGDYRMQQEAIPVGFITVLCDSENDALPGEIERTENSSGRRLALARWLTDWESRTGALVARVRVNRVWQRLFGQGIVPSSGNMGKSGQPPTHPDLLEWLAGEFIRGERRYKPFIKLLMTATAYRQASASDPGDPTGEPNATQADPRVADPDNRLLWHMRLRRLESEIIRDAVLAVSGELDRTIGGPPLMLENHPDGSVTLQVEGSPTASAQGRRSLYVLARRNYNLSMLAAFDQPIMATNCVERTHSAVVSQSLAMLNNDFVVEHAQLLAQRLLEDPSCESDEEQVRTAFQVVLARPVHQDELAWSLGLLEQHRQEFENDENVPEAASRQALAQLCQMLFNSNEFLYVQ